MKIKTILPNRIREACKERDISIRELARQAGISSSEMDRIVGGKEQPTLKQTMTICGVLNVNSYDIFGLKFDRKITTDLDDVLLGSITIWLAEACRRYRVVLSKKEYSQWVSFIYKEVIAKNLNGEATQELTITVTKVIEQIQKTRKRM